MKRLRSPTTIGVCTALLGLLLVLGPVVQSVVSAVTPCSRRPVPEVPANPGSEIADLMSTSAQLTCARPSVTLTIRAVPVPPFDLLLGAGVEPEASEFSPSLLFLEEPKREKGLLAAIAALDMLRGIVLQI